MARVVLGLDIGGANLKAASADSRAVSVPFPLWKYPDRLPAALAELVTQFPEVDEFAVTMTGELCDCFTTKQEGVNSILTAVQSIAQSLPTRVWGTGGRFLDVDEARHDPRTVAAANWHALATFASRFSPTGAALLVDVGSTTTDLIPILDGEPRTLGKTDTERMRHGELLYTGVRRTPVCALLRPGEGAAEFFATVLDVYLLLGHVAESPEDTDTADGRPATRDFAHARLCRMLGGDTGEVSAKETMKLAEALYERQRTLLHEHAAQQVHRIQGSERVALGTLPVAIVSGSGEFLARQALASCHRNFRDQVSLNTMLGPNISACGPAYAVAVLAQERS